MEDKDLTLYFSVLPSEIRYDDRLTSTAKLIYSDLFLLTKIDERDYCEVSNKELSDLYNISSVAVDSCIKALEKYGYIERDTISNIRKIYVL